MSHVDAMTLLYKVKKFKSDTPKLLKSSQDHIRKGIFFFETAVYPLIKHRGSDSKTSRTFHQLNQCIDITLLTNGVRVTRSAVLCACFVNRYLSFCPCLLLTIMVAVLHRF